MNLSPICYLVGIIALGLATVCARRVLWGEKRPY